MSPDRDHESIEDLLAAYALGAAEPADEELVRAHLDGCASCTATVRRLQRALNAVPLAVDPVSPPPELRGRILAAAAASRPSQERRLPQAPLIRLRPELPRTWRPGRALNVAAAALIAFALGAGLGLGIGRSLAPAPTSSVAQYSLTGSGAMSGAKGRVFELRQQGLTLIEFSNLPDLETGKVYELWLIPPQGQPVGAGVFKPDPGGSHVLLLARNLRGLSAVAVTVEAGPNGAAAPSQQPELVGNVG